VSLGAALQIVTVSLNSRNSFSSRFDQTLIVFTTCHFVLRICHPLTPHIKLLSFRFYIVRSNPQTVRITP